MARKNGTTVSGPGTTPEPINTGAGAGADDRTSTGVGSAGAGAGDTGAGSTDRTGAETQTAARADVSAIQVEPQRKRRRDAGTKRAPAVMATAENDAIVVETVLMAVSGIAISVTGEERAAINDSERAAIVPPAVRMLQRADQNAREKIDQFADPIALLIGIGLYAERVYSLSRDKRQEKPKPDRPGLATSQPVTPPAATNPARNNPQPATPARNETPSANPSGSLAAVFGGV